MTHVSTVSLIGRLSECCSTALENAAGLAVQRQHYEIGVAHLMVKLLEDESSQLAHIVGAAGLDAGRLARAFENDLQAQRAGHGGRPVFSPVLLEWIESGWVIGSLEMRLSGQISSGMLLAGLLTDRRLLSTKQRELFESLSSERLKKDYATLIKGSAEAGDGVAETADPGSADTALGKYATNFTRKAAEGSIDPVFGRDREIASVVQILARRRKNNPIIIGEAGVGKTAIVEGLARMIADSSVPDMLRETVLYGLDLGLLQAGASVQGEFEKRLQQVMEEIRTDENAILFIDEAHMLIGAGGAAGTGDAANLLKPALARGELRTIAATTFSEYKKHFEKDPALSRRFQAVQLDEPSVSDAVVILRGLKSTYEAAHEVYITDEALTGAAELSARYISGRQLPDKAIDVLDTACAQVRLGLSGKPDALLALEQERELKQRHLESLQRDVSVHSRESDVGIQELEADIEAVSERIAIVDEEYRRGQEIVAQIVAAREASLQAEEPDPALRDLMESAESQDIGIHHEVTGDAVAGVVSTWTGVPLGGLLRNEADTILSLEERLSSRVKGQVGALRTISEGIRAAKAGLTKPETPLGVFLLVGPSGVGKTETALAIADELFGGERFMVTVNMSEFQEKHGVSRLIGSPPGYVGYGEGGVLTEAVRQRPYSVVLLDEVEKAELDVMNIFYQLFDKGVLSDGEGRVIDFSNTLVLLTSNLATNEIVSLAEQGLADEQITQHVRPILNEHFKPALLARMTVVPFRPISRAALGEIVRGKLNALVRRVDASHGLTIEYAESVVDAIADLCRSPETGARNIDAVLAAEIMPSLSRLLVSRLAEEKEVTTIQVEFEGEGGFLVSES